MKPAKLFTRAVCILITVLCASTAPAQVTPISACTTITLIGSYQLTRNISIAGADCLKIAVNEVTIDLNGFSITGNRTGRAITDLGKARTALTVKNGTLSGFATGVALATSSAVTVENLRVLNMAADGVETGPNSEVRKTQSSTNGKIGILLSVNSTADSDVTSNNGSTGIVTAGYGLVEGNNASGNGGDGIATGSFCNIRHNTVSANKAGGITNPGGCNVSDNAVSSNGFFGIRSGEGSTLTRNNISYNTGNGIEAGPNSTLTNNTASNNTLSGIIADSGSLLSSDTASQNGSYGIYVTCPSSLIGDVTLGSHTPYSSVAGCFTLHNS
jgi:hypothetical protein